MLSALALLALAPSLTLSRTYRDGETDRFQVVIVGEAEGTDLRVEAVLRQTASVPKQGDPRLDFSVEKIKVSAYGEQQSLQKGSKFSYEIDRSGRIVSGWVPEQRSASGVSFLPYLLYGRSFEQGKETVFDYTDPRVRGYSVSGAARLERAAPTADFRGFARVRSAMSSGRPTVVSFQCSFDPKSGKLLSASGSFSPTLQAERPTTGGAPVLNGMQFQLKRL
ncbi:MAG TPA: hypothetical protein DER07_02835 [Armatimonadetes bacterium]|nr:hypothetical protein [Armatimonadota bacterium]